MISRAMEHKNKFLITILAVGLACSLSGCFYLILGGAAAAGGYAISQDTIQGESEKDFEEVWEAAINIVSIMGTVNSQSHELGKISALVNGAKVIVNISQLTPSAVRLKVKARKAFFPSINTAQNVYVKIMNKVNE